MAQAVEMTQACLELVALLAQAGRCNVLLCALGSVVLPVQA